MARSKKCSRGKVSVKAHMHAGKKMKSYCRSKPKSHKGSRKAARKGSRKGSRKAY